MDVLVLNNSYRPVAVTTWQDAITMIYSGRAELVEAYPDKTIRSAAQEWVMPCVVRFLRKNPSRWFKCEPRFTRKNIWIRDKGQCQYCGSAVVLHRFTLDHVFPRSRGGRTEWGNIVVACNPCNQKKEARTPQEANMHLRSSPVAPKVLPVLNESNDPSLDQNVPELWRDYLG
jgi:hypothetical protein